MPIEIDTFGDKSELWYQASSNRCIFCFLSIAISVVSLNRNGPKKRGSVSCAIMSCPFLLLLSRIMGREIVPFWPC